jgi:ribosome-binding ATPase YchF (GTP1/OBG family)
VAEKELAESRRNPHVKAVRDYVKTHLNTEAVVISAQIESDLVDLSETSRRNISKASA